jgi:hypothetical protein
MADAVLVVLLLVFIWAAVLVPPAAGARASREADFLGSIRPGGHPHDGHVPSGEVDDPDQLRFRPALTANARRRQVLGGLVVAIGATLFLGLLPTFRLLLVVHLLLVNSCIAYVALLVHERDTQAARTLARAGAPAPAWRRTAAESRSAPRFAEAVHPYAVLDDDEYAGWYGDGGTDDARYAGAEYADADGAATRFDEDDEYDDEYDTEAAYVDDELGLARPA